MDDGAYDADLRLECLKIAATRADKLIGMAQLVGGDLITVMGEAEVLFNYVKTGEIPLRYHVPLSAFEKPAKMSQEEFKK